MFEEDTERENGTSVSPAHLPPRATGHLRDVGSLPPSPSEHDERSATSYLRPPSGHRRRSGSVPCRRSRRQPPSLRQVRVGRRNNAQRETTTASLLELPTISIPQIVVNDQIQQPDTDYDRRTGREELRSEDVDDSSAAFRPRCQTVSLDPTDRCPSSALPSRTLSLSADLSSSRLVSNGEWIEVLLRRTNASGDAPVSDPP